MHVKRGRPPKVDATEAAELALEQWLQGDPPDLNDEDLPRVREALGDTQYAVEETS